jgi:hypothetical protein
MKHVESVAALERLRYLEPDGAKRKRCLGLRREEKSNADYEGRIALHK